MKILKNRKQIQIYSLFLVILSICCFTKSNQKYNEVQAAETSNVINKNVTINGSSIDEYNRFKGFGTVTCNNTSRLLLDYKEEHPEKYWEIMNRLFNPEIGAGLIHIKIELGADVNSSSGTEPATKRYIDEPANVLRGAGFQFAADAKKINNDITTEILRWGEPRFSWTGSADKNYEAKYNWYKETIDAVKNEYGFSIDYVGLSQNERAQNNGKNEQKWLEYFLENILKEKNYEEDYKKIKYVASDGYRDTKTIASLMLNNKFIRDNIDVISTHYGLSGSTELTNLQNLLINEGNSPKQVWISEGISPMINVRYRNNMEPEFDGLGGTAGVVDVASRIISAYTWTGAAENPLNAVSFDFQPAVASFYEGAAYNPKQLISAYDPWSGFYEEDGGIAAVRQIMNFVGSDNKNTEEDERWQYIKSACYSDGNFADGGVAVNSGDGNYLTLKDPKTNDYTTIYANNTNQTRKYKINTTNLGEKNEATLHLWKTSGCQDIDYDKNWMQHIGEITPSKDGTYEITVTPYSILTVTTLEKDIQVTEHKSNPVDLSQDTVMELPYTDDFEYANYEIIDGKDYVDRRGGTPRYTTDQNGAFEVIKKATKLLDKTSYESKVDRNIPDANDHKNMLQQKMTTNTIGAGWNVWGGTDGAEGTANPNTNIGDHRWTNYKVSYDFLLDVDSEQLSTRPNFTLLGVRQVKAGGNDTQATYATKIFADGKYELLKLGSTVKSGQIEDFDSTKWHNLRIEANENTITTFVDEKKVIVYTDEEKTVMSGRVSIGSGFYETLFDNLKIEPIEGIGYYADKIDSAQGKIYPSESDAISNLTTENPIAYLGNWEYAQSGYAHYNRTLMTAKTTTPVWSGVTVKHTDKGNKNEINKVFYSDGWSSNNNNAWGNTGKYLEIKFKGTEIKIFGEKNPSNGKGDIYIDDEKIDTIDFINNYSLSGQVWEMKDLEDKEHTLKIISTGGYISFIKAEITTTDKILSKVDLPAKEIIKINDDKMIKDTENTVYAYRENAEWGSNDSNAWANFADNPYLFINFIGSGIDFKSNSGSTAYQFELDGEITGNYGPGTDSIFSIRNLEEGKHTLKVSLGNNTQKDTYMDYRGISIYHEPKEESASHSFLFNFKGTGFYLFGNTNDAKISVSVDGESRGEERIYGKGDRQTSYTLTGLENKEHTAKIEILGGSYTLDGIDFLQEGKSILPDIEVEAISINTSALKLIKAKKNFQIISEILPNNATDKTVSYSSSNEDIATVDTSGQVKALKPGIVTITAQTKNEKKASFILRVTQ